MSSSNIRLLVGGDSLQRKISVDEIQHRRYGNADVERLYFDASAGETSRCLIDVLSYSLFDTERIIFLDRVESIPKGDLPALVEYAAHPRSDIPFILFSASEKETPSALLKSLDKKLIRALPKTSKAQIQKLIQERCAKQQVTFERDALDFYFQVCGDHVESALRELEKLLLWADEKGAITLELCRRLVQTEEEKDIWAITNAVGEKNTVLALKALDLLYAQGDEEISIVARLIPNFRTMYQCRCLMAEKIPESEWPKRTGQNPYGLKLSKQRCQGFSLQALQRAVTLLHRIDSDLKGGRPVPSGSHKRILLERLVIDLCRGV